MPKEIVRINKYAGPVIKIGDKCYSFQGTTDQGITHEAPDLGYFPTCQDCELFIPVDSLSSSSGSDSSESSL